MKFFSVYFIKNFGLSHGEIENKEGAWKSLFGGLRFLKPALTPTRVSQSRVKAKTRVDMWDEIEDRGKAAVRRRGSEEQRWLQTFPQNSGDRVSCVYTPGRTSAIHKGIVESLDTKESFRSTRFELLYLSLDSIAIHARVTIDLYTHKESVHVCSRRFSSRHLHIQYIP